MTTWIYCSLREKFTNTGHNRPPNKYESKFICYWYRSLSNLPHFLVTIFSAH